MNLQKIYQQLGLESNLENEMVKFNYRLKAAIKELDGYLCDSYTGYNATILEEVKFILGKPTNITRLQQMINPTPRAFFEGNLVVASAILGALKKNKAYLKLRERLLIMIKEIFDLTLLDIGYTFTRNSIIKRGAAELDQALISQTLTWMDHFPDSREKFENSLRYSLSKDYPDAITNAYSALEGLVKVFLCSDARLDQDKTINELIKRLNLDSYWGQIINHYCKTAHDFSSRHGKRSQNRAGVPPELVEFYIYMTGSFIRLILQRVS